jgi:hypothetical protein
VPGLAIERIRRRSVKAGITAQREGAMNARDLQGSLQSRDSGRGCEAPRYTRRRTGLGRAPSTHVPAGEVARRNRGDGDVRRHLTQSRRHGVSSRSSKTPSTPSWTAGARRSSMAYKGQGVNPSTRNRRRTSSRSKNLERSLLGRSRLHRVVTLATRRAATGGAPTFPRGRACRGAPAPDG